MHPTVPYAPLLHAQIISDKGNIGRKHACMHARMHARTHTLTSPPSLILDGLKIQICYASLFSPSGSHGVGGKHKWMGGVGGGVVRLRSCLVKCYMRQIWAFTHTAEIALWSRAKLVPLTGCPTTLGPV